MKTRVDCADFREREKRTLARCQEKEIKKFDAVCSPRPTTTNLLAIKCLFEKKRRYR